jgi:hypothetical protein
MFRTGTKNPYAVWWSDDAPGSTADDAFVCIAMSPFATEVIAIALNDKPSFASSRSRLIDSAPAVPRREE